MKYYLLLVYMYGVRVSFGDVGGGSGERVFASLVNLTNSVVLLLDYRIYACIGTV